MWETTRDEVDVSHTRRELLKKKKKKLPIKIAISVRFPA